MIAFDADPSHTVPSASYWQQWLFAHYRGTQSLPVTNSQGDLNPLFWGATIDVPKNVIYLKVGRNLYNSLTDTCRNGKADKRFGRSSIPSALRCR